MYNNYILCVYTEIHINIQQSACVYIEKALGKVLKKCRQQFSSNVWSQVMLYP